MQSRIVASYGSNLKKHKKLYRLLKKFSKLLENYSWPDRGKIDVAYWYGERALSGLLAASAWMVRDGWSLEEFTSQRKSTRRKPRRKRSKKSGAPRCDMWLGVGGKDFTIEAKYFPVSVKGLGENKLKQVVANIEKKISSAFCQLATLSRKYQVGCPVGVCYAIPYFSEDHLEVRKGLPKFFRAVRDMVESEDGTFAASFMYKGHAPGDPDENSGKRYFHPGMIVVLRCKKEWRF
jgi:hypothetical protein